MQTIWFCLVAAMIAIYVILDGFDLGAGIVHLLVARSDEERRAVLGTIGPVWDGNEVWLIAGGGTLYFAFPALYASSFSGFYLPLMIVLWLLILRGIAIEFRNHVRSLVWQPLWDVVFAAASLLLAIFFGAALGNVVRGVPLNAAGEFFLPLWTDFRAGPDAGILDWYTVLVAIAAMAALAVHGALWVAMRTEGAVVRRAQWLVQRVWWLLLVLVATITLCSFRLQPHLRESFALRPWGYVFPLAALAGLVGLRLLRGVEAFLASCLFLFGMLTSVAFGLYPYVLPSSGDPALSLSVYNAAAPHYGLVIGLYWFIPGILLTAGYFVYTYSHLARGDGAGH
ncbi:MAG TPA: cytochrome d ubiquinol oxidase subunit II [Candidatus Sulfopaludibacter sp.]|jgi:cytochrome d ubiquinol oxidase subunit II|nr:cytochrome d ubiquinol oxidase subunit II [Candidatus Sulfopaludibacter sp.]